MVAIFLCPFQFKLRFFLYPAKRKCTLWANCRALQVLCCESNALKELKNSTPDNNPYPRQSTERGIIMNSWSIGSCLANHNTNLKIKSFWDQLLPPLMIINKILRKHEASLWKTCSQSPILTLVDSKYNQSSETRINPFSEAVYYWHLQQKTLNCIHKCFANTKAKVRYNLFEKGYDYERKQFS